MLVRNTTRQKFTTFKADDVTLVWRQFSHRFEVCSWLLTGIFRCLSSDTLLATDTIKAIPVSMSRDAVHRRNAIFAVRCVKLKEVY
jgi:hypothetical protein